jgi:hypothetical protein
VRNKSAFRLEPAPYDLSRPLAPPPEREHQDPRIPGQRRTAFWVTIAGQHVGRVALVEPDGHWAYQPEVIDPAATGRRAVLPRPIGEPVEKRSQAIEQVIKEWRRRRRAARDKVA